MVTTVTTNVISLLDNDLGRRAWIAQALTNVGKHVELFDDLAELLAYKPREGIFIVYDEGDQIERLADHFTAHGMPFALIAISDQPLRERIVGAMKHGAIDYLAWPIQDLELLRSIEQALRAIAPRIEEYRAANDHRQRLARLSARERQVLSSAAKSAPKTPGTARASRSRCHLRRRHEPAPDGPRLRRAAGDGGSAPKQGPGAGRRAAALGLANRRAGCEDRRHNDAASNKSGSSVNRPTIDDVAALAGVARTTVSRVLNNQPNVRPAVREKVMAAVEKLGYRVNLQARNLAGRKGLRITMVHASNFDSEPNSYFSSALELGATRAGAALGVQLLNQVINQNDPGAIAEIIVRLTDDQCDGVILTPPFSDNQELLRTLRGLGFAVVCIAGAAQSGERALVIGVDDWRAGYDIGRHLVGQGHRRFGFIKGLPGHASAETRSDGFLSALAEAGLGEDDVEWRRGNFTFRSGHDCAQDLLAGPKRISALACANDDMAAGALLAAHKQGLRIPQDIAITGFDDSPVSGIVWPPLTTVHQPLQRMGAQAVELLVAAVSADGDMAGQRVVGHDLVVRDSTLPAAPA